MYYKSLLYKRIRGIKLSKIYHLKQYFPTDVLLMCLRCVAKILLKSREK